MHGNMLFDLKDDPYQEAIIHDKAIESRMIEIMRNLMIENDAPLEQFERLGMSK